MRNQRLASLFLFAILAGCGNTTTRTGNDCASNPALCACADDTSCSAPKPRCDTRAGTCVACLPTGDNCPAGQHCVSLAGTYTCVPQDGCTQASDCPASGGKPGLCCAKMCADPNNDSNHCGACGNACGAVANGTGGCVNGSCGIVSCNSGFGDCDKKPANGCEANTDSDPLHCGSCDPCKAAPNSKASCTAGACVYDCAADFADCDKDPQNGCETSVTTNPKNCGGCGVACGNLPHATEVACVNKACVPSICAAGFVDCNHLPGDGCESDTQSDPNNCSGCGRKCAAIANGAAGCVMGQCGVGKCDPGFADCDRNVLNGCEQDLLADPKNCGACGKSCNIANGAASCVNGACVLQACNQGFGDCDMNLANGCEASLNSNVGNCGQCGNACPVPAHATATCSFGVCGIGSCLFGWGDCNKNLGDGCETDLLTTQNCGVCGVMCNAPNASTSCKNAFCEIAGCNLGFADCDMKYIGGCEVNVTSDGNNCGACGNVCKPQNNMAGTCVASKCTYNSCLQGFADCNKNLADGCEINLTNDAKNCGGCAVACPMNAPICVNSVCTNVPQNPFFSSMPAQTGSTTRGAGDACGTLITVNQNVNVVAIAVSNNMSAQGNVRFIIWDHPGHNIVYISNGKSFQGGVSSWKQSDVFQPITLVAGKQYDVGGIADVQTTWNYDTAVDNMGGVVSNVSNPNYTNYNAPTISGHAGADCGIQLF